MHDHIEPVEASFNPVTAYAESKVAVERDVRTLASDGFSPVYRRNATAYGWSPRLRCDLVLKDLVARAMLTGEITACAAIAAGKHLLVAGNVKGLHDPYRTPATQEAFAKQWGQNPYMVTSFADGTKISFEQALVANGFGFTVAQRGMYGWDHDGHVDDLTDRFDADQLTELGGIVDYVVKTRPSPGVFVLGTHDDPKQQHYLSLYKLGKGPLYSFYVPYHLCHFEVPSSIARAALLDDAVLAPAGGLPWRSSPWRNGISRKARRSTNLAATPPTVWPSGPLCNANNGYYQLVYRRERGL